MLKTNNKMFKCPDSWYPPVIVVPMLRSKHQIIVNLSMPNPLDGGTVLNTETCVVKRNLLTKLTVFIYAIQIENP